jgi:hypothetical protein
LDRNEDSGEHRADITPAYAKRLRSWVLVFLVFSIASSVIGIESGLYKKFNPVPYYVQARKLSKDPMAVKRQVRINGVDLWIPAAYYKSGHLPGKVQQKDVLLTVMYPSFTPLKERPQALLKKGMWFEHHVTFLIQDRSVMISVQDKHKSLVSFLDATYPRGEKYGGPEYFTPPPDSRFDRGELYLDKDNNELVGLIRCNGDDDGPNPQCSYQLWHQHFLYQMNFDKDLLPQWNDIKKKTLALTEQFKRNPVTPPATSSNFQGD